MAKTGLHNCALVMKIVQRRGHWITHEYAAIT